MSSEILGLSIIQSFSPRDYMIIKVESVVAITKTKYQEVIIADLKGYGRALVLDGLIQSTEIDEYVYHESLVHPVMITHPNPEKILIIGGGEGATLREVLRYNTVKKVVMVDIDGELIELCKKHLKSYHQGAFDDPRAEIVIMDGREYVEKSHEKFDVVILDLTDPYGPEISKALYSQEFYEKIFRVLKDDGLMVTQAGSSFYFEKVYDYVLNNIKKVFPIIIEYNVWIPSFGYACNFIIGSKKYNPKILSANEIEERLKKRDVKDKLRFYSSTTHISLMHMPIYRPSNKR
ncbi:MAG: spermidine synthase [Thermoprotei archaeon]|nr:MAG: spermidine synthase [Thermoprotei archaeon]